MKNPPSFETTDQADDGIIVKGFVMSDIVSVTFCGDYIILLNAF